MPYKFDTTVPVVTVDDKNYPRPTLVNGQWVVNASSINTVPNKIVSYTPTYGIIQPVTPFNTSLDMYNKIKGYENTLAQIQEEQNKTRRLMADITSPHQINSFADVMTAGDTRFVNTGNLFGWGADKAKALGTLMNNMLISPVISDEHTLSEKGKILFNNLIVNLAETMDYITFTNPIKATLIGQTEGKGAKEILQDIQMSFGDVYGQGRKQFDWNINTGSAIGDTVVNTILEIVSDPTTWISFGTSAAIKQSGKGVVGDVIRKSFDDIGMPITKSQADNLAQSALRTYIYKDNSLVEAVSKLNLSKGIKKQASAMQIEQFYYTLKNNAKVLTDTTNLNVLKSVYNTSENIQKLALKTTGYTSALGWGYHAVKGALTLGLDKVPYALSKINNIISKVDVDNINLKNLPEHMDILEVELTSLKQFVDMAGDMPQQTVLQATRTYQEHAYIAFKNIIEKGKHRLSAEVLSDLNKQAAYEGFDDIFDMFSNLLKVKSAMPPDLRKMVYEIGNSVTQIFDNAVAQTVRPVIDVLNKTALEKMVPTEYNTVIERLQKLKQLEITQQDFSDSLYDGAIASFRARMDLFEHSEQKGLNAYIREYNILKDFGMFTIDPKYIRVRTFYHQPSQSYRSIKIPTLDLDIATATNLREALKALEKVQQIDNVGVFLSDETTKHITYVWDLLNAWDDDTLSIAMVKEANKSLAFIKHALQEYNKYALDETADLLNETIATTYMLSIDMLYTNLVEFVENKTRASRTPSNEAVLFTDSLVGREAENLGSVALDGIARLVKDKRLPPSYAEKMYTQLTDYNPNILLDAKSPAVQDALAHLTEVSKFLEDIDTGSYFIRELGLEEVIDDWADNGFTIEFGEKLLATLDDAKEYMQKKYNSGVPWGKQYIPEGSGKKVFSQKLKDQLDFYTMLNKKFPGQHDDKVAQLTEAYNASGITEKLYWMDSSIDIIERVQLLRDEIQELIDIGSQTIDQRVKMTQQLQADNMYALQLSKIQTLSMLLNANNVQDLLHDVRQGRDIGQLLQVLEDPSLSTNLADAVGHVQSLSKSVYVTNRIIDLVQKSDLPDQVKDGLYDTFAGYSRMKIDKLDNPSSVGSNWLYKTKAFIDNITNAHSPMYNELTYSGNTLDNVEYLYKAIFAPLSIEPGVGKVNIIADYWAGISDALLEDGNKHFNVVYSVGQTGYKSGTIYDIALGLPNGDSIKFVDASVRNTVLQTLDNRTARKLHGKSKTEVINNIRDAMAKEAGNPNVRVFDSTEEFAEALFGFFAELKKTSYDNKLIPRLVGFNTAVDSFGTDQLLSRFMTMNRLNVRVQYSDVEFKNLFSIKTFDAAQFLRVKHEGAFVITNDMLTEVIDIASKAKAYLDEANTDNPHVPGYLVPDFNTAVTASFREILAAVDNTIAIIRERAERPRALLPHDFRDVTREQFRLLTHTFSLRELQGFRTKLSNTLQGIGDTLLNIKQSNNELGQHLLIQSAISRHTGERNVMNVLYKYFIQPGGVPVYSYKKVYDRDTFTEWFGTSLPNVEDLHTYTNMQRIADVLERARPKIKHSLLLMEMDNKELIHTVEFLKEEFIKLPNYRFSAWGKEVMMLQPGNNPINNYIIAKYLWDNIQKVSLIDDINRIADALVEQIPGTRMMMYLRAAEDTVMYNDPLYIAGIDVLHSEAIKDSNYIMQLTREIEEVTKVKGRAETLYDSLFLDQRIRDERGLSLPSIRTKEIFIKRFTAFIDVVQGEIDKAFNEYLDELPGLATAFDRLQARKVYTAKVEGVISQLDDISLHIANSRARYITSLSPESYAKFLYKFSQGVQVFDMGAEIFQDASDMFSTFMRTVTDGAEHGIRYVEDIPNKRLIVYLKGDIDLEHMAKITEDFVLDTPKLSGNIGGPIQQAYYEYVDMMNEFFDGAYSLSMHRTMNNARFQELLDFLPEEVKTNMISLEHLDANNMIEGLFNQTIVGDYTSGVGSIFSVYSGNIVTNTAAGFNVAFNRMRGKDMYTTLIFNQEHSLKAWVEGVSRLGRVEQDEVVDAITKNNYVVAELKDGKVFPIDIRKPSEYKRALETSAALLDYHTYTRSVEVLNISYNSNKLSRIVTKYLGAIKLGQLMSFGWLLRNIMDSSVKGWIQSGLDPMYVVSSVTRTKKIMAQYDATYAAIFKATGGNLTPKNVAEFFAKNTDDLLLEESLFKKLLTFYSNSASVPTAAQLALDNDIITKLYNRVKGDDNITRSHVKRALEIFKDTASTDNPFQNAHSKLKGLYTEDVATTLILLRKYVPDKELKKARVSGALNKIATSNIIMRKNNDVETFVRTHTFLYHSVYNDGTIAEGLKAVDISQFNRARDSGATRMMEHLLPFSTFQMDNFLFWGDMVKDGKGNLISLSENILNGMYDEEQLDLDELARNMSLQYLYTVGNIILDDETGEVFKLNDSLHNTLQLVTSPIDEVSNMLNVPIDVIRKLAIAINADEEAYDKDKFNNPKPISKWNKEDYSDEMLQLIPLVGVLHLRYSTAKEKFEMSDAIMPLVFPSIFGVAKLDSAGTTYESRPIGTDWYNRDEEYKATHRYVFGVSYVPSWMTKDMRTYADTFTRLQRMGYSEGVAAMMMQNGWYMKAPSYTLRHYSQPIKRPDKVYHKRAYADRTYAKPTYYKYVKNVKKPKTFIMKSSKPYILTTDRTKTTRRNHVVRRIYRPTIYNDRFTRTGVSRETLIKWRGPNRSSRQLLRDRSAATRRRMQRIQRQVRPL